MLGVGRNQGQLQGLQPGARACAASGTRIQGQETESEEVLGGCRWSSSSESVCPACETSVTGVYTGGVNVGQKLHLNPKGEGRHLVLLIRPVRLGGSDPTSQKSNNPGVKPKNKVQHIKPGQQL